MRKRLRGRYDFAGCGRGVFYFFGGSFGPPGRYNKQETQHTPLTRTQQQHSSSRCWSCRNPAAPTRRPAPIKALTSTETVGEACAALVKRRPRGRARRRQLTRLLRRWYSADHSLAFTLRASNWSLQQCLGIRYDMILELTLLNSD